MMAAPRLLCGLGAGASGSSKIFFVESNRKMKEAAKELACYTGYNKKTRQ